MHQRWQQQRTAAAAAMTHRCRAAPAPTPPRRQRRRQRQAALPPPAAESTSNEQQKQQLPWPAPPWNPWDAIAVTGVVAAVDHCIPALVVGAAARAQGVAVVELGFDERQLLNLCCQLLQLAATAGALRAAVARHPPAPPPWWRFEPSLEALLQGASGAVAAVGTGLLLAAYASGHSDGAAEWGALAALHGNGSGSGSGSGGGSGSGVGFSALLAGAALLSPATEELLFRGYLLPSLAVLLRSTPAAVALSAAAFAAVHPAEGGAAGYAAEAALGALLGLAAVAGGGNLAVPLVGHALYNALVVLVAAASASSGGGGGGGGGNAA